jgi:glycerol-3-phosphate dehydrogenase
VNPAVTRNTRRQSLESFKNETFDVLIVGGGINGAGTARDLALRSRIAGVPLKIALVERRHFASGTSGKNSQLIHGGLRYLKYFEFNLVREALRERAILLDIAPHLVEPLAFLMPIRGFVADLFYNTGLWIYEKFAGDHRVGSVRRLSFEEIHELEPNLGLPGLTSGAEFYDCRVHSARLVLENIFEAVANGACAANYVGAEITGAELVKLTDHISGEIFEARARKIVDATGPWARDPAPRLVRGSHIILPRLLSSDHAIAYFEESGRIIFVIPWGHDRNLTLVGTTDVDHDAGPDCVQISDEEVRYLLGIVRTLFPDAISAAPIAGYSSLRPLAAAEEGSPTAASREHRIWNDQHGIVRITGGKYTTYRAMSEEAADLVCEEVAPNLLDIHRTALTPVNGNSREALKGIDSELRDYGVFADSVARLEPRTAPPGMTRREAAQMAYAVEHEMAQYLDDFLTVSTYLAYERSWDADSRAAFQAEFERLSGAIKQ